MQPAFFWGKRRYSPVWHAVAILLLVLGLWGISQGGVRTWFTLLGSAWFWMYFPVLWVLPPVYMLADGVLTVAQSNLPVRLVPLGGAEVERGSRGGGWVIRWLEGKSRKSLRVAELPGLDPALQEAVASARAAGAPLTTREAGRLVGMWHGAFDWSAGKWAAATAGIILSSVALSVSAIYLNQPLLLAPLTGLPFFYPLWIRDRKLALAGESLWVLEPDQEPCPIPLADVTSVDTSPDLARVFTRHPRHPVILVNQYQSGDLLRRLKRRPH